MKDKYFDALQKGLFVLEELENPYNITIHGAIFNLRTPYIRSFIFDNISFGIDSKYYAVVDIFDIYGELYKNVRIVLIDNEYDNIETCVFSKLERTATIFEYYDIRPELEMFFEQSILCTILCRRLDGNGVDTVYIHDIMPSNLDNVLLKEIQRIYRYYLRKDSLIILSEAIRSNRKFMLEYIDLYILTHDEKIWLDNYFKE